MTNSKYTSRQFYNDILEGTAITDTMKNFAKAAIAKMDEKNEKRKNGSNPTAKQKANAEIAKKILATMTPDTVLTSKSVMAEFGFDTSQAATGILSSMVNAGQVERFDYSPTGKKKDQCKGYRLPTTPEE